MNEKILSEALGNIREEYILEALALGERQGAHRLRQIKPAGNGRALRRTGRTALIAAALTLLLAVTAFAVYQYSLKDALAQIPGTTVVYENAEALRDLKGELTMVERQELSLNGFSDSPEYQAYAEWKGFQAQWQMENPDWFHDRGVDDSYYETPENYALLYGAYAQEQAQKLDELQEKYGLAVHTSRTNFSAESQLCRALGIDELIGGGYDIIGEYIYDDGTFHALGKTKIGGRDEWVEIDAQVKGSFTCTGNEAPTGEEWSYVTAGGQEVIMAAYEDIDRICVLAGLEGCYVSAYIDTADRALAEAFADSINWPGLDTCFATAAARRNVRDGVARLAADNASATVAANLSDGAAINLDILGNYYIEKLPEACELYSTGYTFPSDGNAGYYAVRHYYQGKGIGVDLIFRTLEAGETAPEPGSSEAPDFYPQEACTVNGYGAVLTAYAQEDDYAHYCVEWLDTEREVCFRLDIEMRGLTREEALAMAESVTPEDPAREANAAAYKARAAGHQAEIDAVIAQDRAEQEAWEAAYDAQVQEALERLGDYDVTARGYTCTGVQAGPVDIYSDWLTGEQQGYTQLVQKNYKNAADDQLILCYERFWSAEDETELLNAQEYERSVEMREAFAAEGPAASYTDGLEVNGCKAYYMQGVDHAVVWLDEAAGLTFHLNQLTASGASGTADELIALAETVKPAA